MSQIEMNFQTFLSKKPEIEKCYSEGLINRRALARYLIENKVAGQEQEDAIIAMLRRYDFKKKPEQKDSFRELRTSMKDNLVILNFKKEHETLQHLNKIVSQTNYNIAETLKIIIGTSNITLIIDKDKEKNLKLNYEHKQDNVSEISLLFSKNPVNAKGIISIISRELYLSDITISELLTASNELLIYLKEEHVLRAYEIIKSLSKN